MGTDLLGRHLLDPEQLPVKVVEPVGNDGAYREFEKNCTIRQTEELQTGNHHHHRRPKCVINY
jgi:hypothetical protein